MGWGEPKGRVEVPVHPGQVVVVLDLADARTLEAALRMEVVSYEYIGMKGRVLRALRDVG